MDYSIFADWLFVIGRILFGGYFLISGWNHFRKTEMLAGYAGSKGVPSPKLAVLASGALLVLGGLGILAGIYPEFSVFCIAVFLVPVTPKMHAYWKIADPMARSAEMVNFRKNIALLGAALMFLLVPHSVGSSAASSAWPFSLF